LLSALALEHVEETMRPLPLEPVTDAPSFASCPTRRVSTKEQMTAVERVNVAIGNVAQASRETEVSSGQTQETALQLAQPSKNVSTALTERAHWTSVPRALLPARVGRSIRR
jgi:hypothetical protein